MSFYGHSHPFAVHVEIHTRNVQWKTHDEHADLLPENCHADAIILDLSPFLFASPIGNT